MTKPTTRHPNYVSRWTRHGDGTKTDRHGNRYTDELGSRPVITWGTYSKVRNVPIGGRADADGWIFTRLSDGTLTARAANRPSTFREVSIQ